MPIVGKKNGGGVVVTCVSCARTKTSEPPRSKIQGGVPENEKEVKHVNTFIMHHRHINTVIIDARCASLNLNQVVPRFKISFAPTYLESLVACQRSRWPGSR